MKQHGKRFRSEKKVRYQKTLNSLCVINVRCDAGARLSALCLQPKRGYYWGTAEGGANTGGIEQ